ncbi:transcriptional regulator PpsR [Methylobacterium oryzihabitans]|uniref:Transcriptional regulator PpsR n=1 Tax=Methylobacterium oryzihabitans TaxID=2499852 RepID=A0A3S2VYJ8_9HYPH|nr:transcriptional regulator PpsR [Methylobacterium oryzihabitans]RVU20745.1 transcriptional regulator PpsR [Methylobacterium oryzihabitans]
MLRDAVSRLDPRTTGSLVAAASDVSLVVDGEGVIRDAAFGADGLSEEAGETWLGRRWIDTVTVESRPKVASLLEDAGLGAVTRWRQVNHPSAQGGADVPIRYAALRIPDDDRIIVIGRDLRALSALQQRLAESQQALERDYARLRSAETRYRVLFQLAGEPILIVDASTRRITEINPAAARLLGRATKRIVGRDLVDLFEPEGARAVQALLVGLRLTGQAEDLSARLAQRRGEARVSATLFREESGSSIVVRLAVVAPAASPAATRSGALEVIEAMPEGFVVTDRERRIVGVNAAFLDLAQLATEHQAKGESLERWLGREGTEIGTLFATLAEHGSVRHFATVIRGEFGVVEEVEVAAVSVPGGGRPCFGFTLRTLPRRVAAVAPGGRELPRSVEHMTELVGRVSMKALVRETTDLIERLCIEAALRITHDNRASAAEMLGLSRQGFYAKMRRYGLGDLDGAEEPEESES